MKMKCVTGRLTRVCLLTLSTFVLASSPQALAQHKAVDSHKAVNSKHHGGHHQDAKALAKHLDAADRDSWQQPNKVLALFGKLKGQRVLDIGAGTGYFSFKLAEAGAKVIAADADPEFLQMIESKQHLLKVPKTELETRKIPFDSPGLAKQEVDSVLIVDTYHHIDARVAYFTQVKQGIKQGGQLVVVDYKPNPAIQGGPPMSMRLSAEKVKQELIEAGFRDIQIDSNLLHKQYVIQAHVPQADIGTSRMKDFWDQAYEKDEYLFGTEPDGFFAQVLPRFRPGRLLLPGEGEGRNAVFAAKLGWDVTAYDYSEAAKVKAEKLAAKNGVSIVYDTKDIMTAHYPDESFDAIAFLSIHFNQTDRREIHGQLDKQLKSGGLFILHAFSIEHPKYNSAGPQTPEHLYSEADILRDFPDYEVIKMETVREYLKEGPSEMGDSSVFRFVGRKP